MDKKFYSILILVLLSFLLLFGCTQGSTTDLMTGQKTDNKGLSFEETYLSVDNKVLNSNEVKVGEKVKIFFAGMAGFKLDENKLVHPGLSIKVLDVDGNVLISSDNALAKYTLEGVERKLANDLSASLTVGKPLVVGQEYTVKVRIWDALGEGEVSSEVILKVVE